MAKFNLLTQTFTIAISEASEVARKLLDVITVENSVDVIVISELLGLGITAELKEKADALALEEMEAEDKAAAEAAGITIISESPNEYEGQI